MILIGINNIHSPSQTSYWKYYIQNFEEFKELITFLFGNGHWYPYLSPIEIVDNFKSFWYLFIPIGIGVMIILMKKDRYLFCMLILPLIIAEFIGWLHIYPLSPRRVSLWLYPIFIILFTIPTIYIKFNKKIFSFILFLILIIYYSYIFNNNFISYVKNLLKFDYAFGYDNSRVKHNILINQLSNTDITENDIICINEGFERYFEDLCQNEYFINNQKIFDCNINIYSSLLRSINNNDSIYVILNKQNNLYAYENSYRWIIENMDIIYEYDTWYGDKIIKVKKK